MFSSLSAASDDCIFTGSYKEAQNFVPQKDLSWPLIFELFPPINHIFSGSGPSLPAGDDATPHLLPLWNLRVVERQKRVAAITTSANVRVLSFGSFVLSKAIAIHPFTFLPFLFSSTPILLLSCCVPVRFYIQSTFLVMFQDEHLIVINIGASSLCGLFSLAIVSQLLVQILLEVELFVQL